MTAYSTPRNPDPPAPEPALPALGPQPVRAKPLGRRPTGQKPTASAPAWLYHHLVVTGPAAAVAEFADAVRGSGVIPWQLDTAAIEEDVFNLAASQPAARRRLSIEGCRILTRQFRDRVEARQARAAALVGRSLACPFDLHTVLPVPAEILQQGPAHPGSLAWLRQHWGVSDGLRHVAALTDPRPGRRLPRGHAVRGYGFFTAAETPHAAVAGLTPHWPALRLALQVRPD